MAVQLVTAADCAPQAPPGPFAGLAAEYSSYLRDFLCLGPATLVATRDLERLVLMVGGKPLPVVVNDGSEEDCYLLSPYAHYVKYMLIELRKISGAQARALEAAVRLAGQISLGLGFNRCVSVNNWLMTTNPALRLTAAELSEITEALTTRYPRLPIVFRTVDARPPAVSRMFQEAGYKLVVNRPVHEWDSTRLKHNHRRQIRTELRLLDDPRFTVSDSAVLEPGDEETVHRLYTALYVVKHRGYNCRYTARFFRSVYDSGLMQFLTIRYQGRIVAFGTTFEDGPFSVLALVGYDTSLDKKVFPLYRMLFAGMLRRGLESGRLMFLSTGAASFKLRRGSYEWMEHEAVYDRHLPAHRRIPWSMFKAMLDAGTKGLGTDQM
jgi:hypothetical protein